MPKRAIWIAASLAALVFAWVVWPTPYRYHTLGPITARENRFTGKVEGLYSSGWTELKPTKY